MNDFFSNARPVPSGCLEWQGRTDKDGYGLFGKAHRAHRYAYAITKGDPGSLQVCHSCDNRRCINPDHLWLGTAAENMRDCVAKKRFVGTALTHCKRGHPFDEKNTYYRGSPTRRECRACRAAARRQLYLAKRQGTA